MNLYSKIADKISPRYLKIAGISLLSIITLLFLVGVVAFFKRESILNNVIERAIAKAKNDYNLNVKIKSAHFSGLKTVVFDEISVVPENRDTLADIKTFRVGVRLIPLFFGNIKLAELTLHQGRVTLIKRDSISNYDFLFKKKTSSNEEKTRVNLAELANNLLNKLLNKVPDDMDIKNFLLSYRDDENASKFDINSAVIDGGDVKSTVFINDKESVWHISGDIEPDDQQFNLSLFADGKKVELPFLEKKYRLKLNFDTAQVQMHNVDLDGSEFKFTSNLSVKNLLINHSKIAGNDIIVPDGSIDANMIIGESFISVDSSSVIHLKNIQANPYIKYTLSPSKIYELKLHTDYVNAQQLLNAFPQGLFESLEGMRVSGDLQYDLNFYLDESQPDDVQFDSRLNKRGFKIVGWGKTNLQKINGTFVYTPFEYGKPMRNITVGPENSNFIPLNEISDNLKNAVLTAEDPSFLRHNGFVIESFRKSIATDFKEKAFTRGGSTISMQLVKNAYLNRQKNLARKIEEIFIVWLIENNHLLAKQRMLEVYLNIIEWGRNVYGIGEASRYYFDKHPSQLNVGESIFLARIVPMPKSSLYFFNGDGSLRPSLRGYFRLIGGLMARKGLTAPDTSGYGFYSVRLKESLRQIVPADSLSIDSLNMDDDSEPFFKQMFEDIKPDTISINDIGKLKFEPRDTVKTAVERRRDRREERKQEREQKRKKN